MLCIFSGSRKWQVLSYAGVALVSQPKGWMVQQYLQIGITCAPGGADILGRWPLAACRGWAGVVHVLDVDLRS